MWSIISVAFEAAVTSLAGYSLLLGAKAPDKPSVNEIVGLNVVCVVAATAFELFFDDHGPAPTLAYALACFEPLLLASVLLVRRSR